MAECLNVVGLARNGHRYVFLCDDDGRNKLTETLHEFVDDPELDFTESDALLVQLQIPDSSQPANPADPKNSLWM
ncbi:MAG: hypothetical protein ACO3FE_06525 [Planctomycetaceae bacterium]|jgi:hypothetical protein